MKENKPGERPAGTTTEVATSVFGAVSMDHFPLGRERRGRDGGRFCHGGRRGGTLMRYGTLTGPIILLAAGVVAGSLRGPLVPFLRRLGGLLPADRPTLFGTVRLAPVAPGADPDLCSAVPAVEDPVTLCDGRRPPGCTKAFTAAARERYSKIRGSLPEHLAGTWLVQKPFGPGPRF